MNLPYTGEEHYDELAGPDTFVGREAPGPQVAIYGASGEQISFEIHPWNEPDPLSEIHGQVYEGLTKEEKKQGMAPKSFEIGETLPIWALPKREGFFRAITDGVDVPEQAIEGLSPGRFEFLAITPDTNDDDVVWVLMAGGTDLYKGTVVQADQDAKPADCV